ncbi:MAG: DNA/RNA helicase domain-containing protein, partial [bacterium]
FNVNYKNNDKNLKEKLNNNIEEMLDSLKEKSINNKEMLDSLEKKLNNIKEMLDALKEKSITNKVALVAAFTESDGYEFKLRVGHPLKSGFNKYKGLNIKIYWLMDEEEEYPSYWLTNKSNELTHCASIYGCQGFEADYVGVIWGRDLVWRQNGWQLGDNCEDNVGGDNSLKKIIEDAKKGNKQEEALAIELLKNRYRTFLTRGISGT